MLYLHYLVYFTLQQNLFSLSFREGQLVGGDAISFKFNMQALAAYLKKQSEQGSNASYYNIDILKYQVKAILLSMPLKSRHDIEIL